MLQGYPLYLQGGGYPSSSLSPFQFQIILATASLVREHTKLAPRARTSWSPKARRWYQRLLSGVNHHQANGRRIRVMTLTTSPRGRAISGDLNDSWEALRKRIGHRFKAAAFEYWKLRTSEGNGVLHVVYSGTYIPHSWLSRTWQEIHASPIVYIQELRRTRKKLASYLMSHYLPGHDEPRLYTRMSWSWGWVFRGFCAAWKYYWKRAPTMYEAIHDWNKLMRRSDPLYYYKMKRGWLYKQDKLC